MELACFSGVLTSNFFTLGTLSCSVCFMKVVSLQFLDKEAILQTQFPLKTVFVCLSNLRKFEIDLVAFSTIQEIRMKLAFLSGTVFSNFFTIQASLWLCLPSEGNFLEFFNKEIILQAYVRLKTVFISVFQLAQS